MILLRRKYVEQLLRELNNEHSDDVEQDKILLFIEDILRYLEDDKDEEYEINQGIRYKFRTE